MEEKWMGTNKRRNPYEYELCSRAVCGSSRSDDLTGNKDGLREKIYWKKQNLEYLRFELSNSL